MHNAQGGDLSLGNMDALWEYGNYLHLLIVQLLSCVFWTFISDVDNQLQMRTSQHEM